MPTKTGSLTDWGSGGIMAIEKPKMDKVAARLEVAQVAKVLPWTLELLELLGLASVYDNQDRQRFCETGKRSGWTIRSQMGKVWEVWKLAKFYLEAGVIWAIRAGRPHCPCKVEASRSPLERLESKTSLGPLKQEESWGQAEREEEEVWAVD